MPAGVVKPGEEKYWEQAKKSCAQFRQGTDRYWRCVNGTFQTIRDNARRTSRRAVHDTLTRA